jgi:hypothetical protein
MGIRYQVQAEDLVFTVVDDVQITYVALLTGALVDEILATPLDVTPVIKPDPASVAVKLADGALFALTGYAELVFPKLSTTAYTLKFTVTAPGYLAQTITVPVPAGTTLPVAYPPIAMRPMPVRIQGRVVTRSTRSPIPNAQIKSSDNTVLLLRSPLYFDHSVGVTVNAYSFNPAGGSLKLAAAIRGGDNTIFLNNNAGLTSKTLQIGADPLAEVVTVQGVGPAAGQANLSNKLNSSFTLNDPVQLVTPTALGPNDTLQRSGDLGDGLLVLSAGLTAPGVQVQDGVKTEFHLLSAVSDADGFYHLNGVAGVPLLRLFASSGGLSTPTTWFVNYNDPVNLVDFRL